MKSIKGLILCRNAVELSGFLWEKNCKCPKKNTFCKSTEVSKADNRMKIDGMLSLSLTVRFRK